MKYRESQETYLETILLLKQKNSVVYSVDIANELNYSRASVSRAVNLLCKKGFISVDKSGAINFTEEGNTHALQVYDRHKVIKKLLVKIGANNELAEDNACRIEHVISEDLVDIIKSYIDGGGKWLVKSLTFANKW